MSFHSSGPSPHGSAPGRHEPDERAVGGHTNTHGRPGSWALVAVITAAFVAGAFAIVFRLWPLFWVCAGLVLLSVPAGKVIGIMGDTVLAGNPAMQEGHAGPVAEDTGSAADPGVDVGTPGATAIDRGANPDQAAGQQTA